MEEIVYEPFFNPLYPPLLGDFRSWGAPPDPRQRGLAPLDSPVAKQSQCSSGFSGIARPGFYDA